MELNVEHDRTVFIGNAKILVVSLKVCQLLREVLDCNMLQCLEKRINDENMSKDVLSHDRLLIGMCNKSTNWRIWNWMKSIKNWNSLFHFSWSIMDVYSEEVRLIFNVLHSKCLSRAVNESYDVYLSTLIVISSSVEFRIVILEEVRFFRLNKHLSLSNCCLMNWWYVWDHTLLNGCIWYCACRIIFTASSNWNLFQKRMKLFPEIKVDQMLVQNVSYWNWYR